MFIIKFKCPYSGRKYNFHSSYCYIRDDLFRTQILHKSLDNIFYMIQSTYFSPVFWNSLRFKRGPNFQGWGGKPILQNNWIAWIEGASFLGRNQALLKNSWIIWSPLLYFNFKTFKDPNSLSFIRFQCVLYDSEEFLSDFWNFYKLKGEDLLSGGNQFCRKSELFGPLLLYFNFKSFMDPNFSSFIRF